MKNQLIPDYCQSATIAVVLLQIYAYKKELLSEDILFKIKEACINTCFALLNDCTSTNTHTILYEVFATVFCGELFDCLEFVSFGEQIMQNFYNNINLHYDFLEPQQVDFSVVMTRLISAICSNIHSKLCTELSNCFNDILWNSIATHFHVPTMQWVGPHARSKNVFLSDSFLEFLQGATQNRLHLLPAARKSINELASCPQKYYPYFTNDAPSKFYQRLIFNGYTYPYFAFSLVSASYIQPDYTIGSFNREEFWSERHPVIGYFGNREKPRCFRVQVLNDGHDFASAALHSVQFYGTILGHITFQTNRGNTHIRWDAPNPQIETDDLRIRFSVQGSTENIVVTHNENSISLQYDEVKIIYTVPYIKIDDFPIHFETSQSDSCIYFDIVLYHGEKKLIDFENMKEAICCFCLTATKTDRIPYTITNVTDNGCLFSSAILGAYKLSLETPLKPNLFEYNLLFDRQYINDTEIEKYSMQTTEKTKAYSSIENISSFSTIRFPLNSFKDSLDELSAKIDALQNMEFMELADPVKEIFELIDEKNYSLLIIKRLAVQIVVNIFDSTKKNSLKPTQAIHKKHSEIYQKIALAESIVSIRKSILSFYSHLQKDIRKIELAHKDNAIVNAIVEIIRKNLLNPDWSLSKTAEQLGYSDAHISRIFSKTLGINYITYVQKLKMNYAKEALLLGNYSIDELSEILGYSNTNSFRRVFKQINGMAITQFIQNPHLIKK